MSALTGVRVVELARILAGPWVGQTLADLGADVVKVESPEGDDTRRWGPPFIETGGERAAAYFHGCNRGKRSIVADFATERGREIVRRSRGALGRADREFQGRRPGEVWPRLREPEAPQSAPRLLFGHRLRPDRALRRARRLRFPHPGHVRLHGRHGRSERRAAEGRRRGLRPLHRALRRHRNRSGADRARAQRARLSRSTSRSSTRWARCSPTRR